MRTLTNCPGQITSFAFGTRVLSSTVPVCAVTVLSTNTSLPSATGGALRSGEDLDAHLLIVLVAPDLFELALGDAEADEDRDPSC